MDEQLLGELALTLQVCHQLRDLLSRCHRLKRHHVYFIWSAGGGWGPGAEKVGQANAIVAGLAGKHQPVELSLARSVRIPEDELVALRVAGEIAEQRPRMQVVLLAPHPLQAW